MRSTYLPEALSIPQMWPLILFSCKTLMITYIYVRREKDVIN